MAVRTPAISVCIPTYNGAEFLAETLASAAAQTFDDFEIVIVDDGSTDATLDIAERFARQEPRARVIRNAERAGSSARNANRCVEEARGEWIKFLFQDDLLAPDCLAKMLEAGRRGPLVISWHRYLFSSAVADEVRRFYQTLPTLGEVLPTDYADANAFSSAVMARLGVNFIGPTSSSFIHRRCFSTYGPFSREIVSYPDLEFWMRVGSNEGLSIVPEPLVSFRVHDRSISGQLRGDTKRERRGRLEWLHLLWLIGHTPEYIRFNEVAKSWSRPLDAVSLLRGEALDLRWEALEARHRRGDRDFLADYNAFCERNPPIRAIVGDHDAALPFWTRFKMFAKARS
jgi:glycosyltransferase involved in cell wall biosynthesis